MLSRSKSPQDRIRRISFDSRLLFVVLVVLVGLLVVMIDPIPFILATVSRGSATFGLATVTIGLGTALIGIMILVHNAIFGKPRRAVGQYIMLLPLFSLFHRIGGITVDVSADEPIILSLSTFLLFLLAAIFYLRGIKMRKPGDPTFEAFEKLLWVYALTGSAVQLFNHNLVNAFWVSVDGMWEFLLLFYVMTAVAKSRDDLQYFFRCIVGFLIVGLLLAIGNNTFFGQYVSSDLSMRFTYANSAPGAIAVNGLMGLMLALYLARSSVSKGKRAFWLGISFMVIGLVVLTQTRGGILGLSWLALLLLYKQERSWFAVNFLIPAFLWLLLLHEKIVKILGYRPMSADLMSIDSVSFRLEAWRLSIPITFSHCLVGFGIGNPVTITDFYRTPVGSHNLVFYLLQDVGIIATISFLSLFFYAILKLNQASFSKNTPWQQRNLTIYLMVALAIWFAYANINGLSITTHSWSGAHEEDTMLFYVILYLAGTAISIYGPKSPKTFPEGKG